MGVFLGSVAAFAVYVGYMRYEARQLEKVLAVELAKLQAENAKAEAELRAMAERAFAPVRSQAQPQRTYAPLRDNERCMQGRRFRRVENGWIQINQPCG